MRLTLLTPEGNLHKPIKYIEKGLAVAAGAAWGVFAHLNRIRRNPGFIPKWADKPLLKSWEKQKPTLGWPRETDSLCPKCVPEIRKKILDGELPVEILRREKVGEIKAQIVERDGKILMIKECPIHGRFEDVMSIDPVFYAHIEKVFPGRDIRAHSDEKLHNHGSSTVTHGRGSVLTIDLTNRCNMMCDPCFMDAIRYARQVGYNSVQAATNGIEFAKSAEFCRKAAEAGLRYAYLQFDGIGNAANSHRHVGNLFDVKMRAIENLWSNGVDIVPVITLVNGVNNEQVGRVVAFALDNPKK